MIRKFVKIIQDVDNISIWVLVLVVTNELVSISKRNSIISIFDNKSTISNQILDLRVPFFSSLL